MADELVAFLRARLDEDEHLAGAASPAPWSANAEHDEVLAIDGETVADGFALSGRQLRATVDHIVRHDPLRVLREVEAKRKIVDEYAEALRILDGFRETGWEEGHREALLLACKVLAAAYADHSDYRTEWRL